LYELAPAARRFEPEVPYDPYDLSVWPVRRITPRRSELRYQFHTRNLEMPGLLRPLSRAVPSLTFVLATLCFDDSTAVSYRFARGIEHEWHDPDPEVMWQRARKKFRLSGDEVYMDDHAEHWVEEKLLEEALNHWTAPRNQSAGRAFSRKSWNQPRVRDLASERELALIEITGRVADPLRKKDRNKRGSAKPDRSGRRRRKRTPGTTGG
jgi:hypothetical protein